MLIKLHSQATTTPKVRAAIQASDEPAWVLADRHGTRKQTVWKWRILLRSHPRLGQGAPYFAKRIDGAHPPVDQVPSSVN
jgi:hypothetical protein